MKNITIGARSSSTDIRSAHIMRTMLGDRIKQARALRECKQAWLADMIGMRQATLSNVESNESGVSLERFVAIADALKVDMRWLATGEGSPELQTGVQKPPAQYEAQAAERDVLWNLYSTLSADQQKTVLALLRGMQR